MLISQAKTAYLAQNTQFGSDYTTYAQGNCAFACIEWVAPVGLNLEGFPCKGLCWSVSQTGKECVDLWRM